MGEADSHNSVCYFSCIDLYSIHTHTLALGLFPCGTIKGYCVQLMAYTLVCLVGFLYPLFSSSCCIPPISSSLRIGPLLMLAIGGCAFSFVPLEYIREAHNVSLYEVEFVFLSRRFPRFYILCCWFPPRFLCCVVSLAHTNTQSNVRIGVRFLQQKGYSL